MPDCLARASTVLIVQTDVEHRVHHAGHRVAGAERQETSSGLVGRAELGPHLFFDLGHGLIDQLAQLRADSVSLVIVEIGADVGADGEAGGHRQTEVGHFGQVGTFAAQKGRIDALPSVPSGPNE